MVQWIKHMLKCHTRPLFFASKATTLLSHWLEFIQNSATIRSTASWCILKPGESCPTYWGLKYNVKHVYKSSLMFSQTSHTEFVYITRFRISPKSFLKIRFKHLTKHATVISLSRWFIAEILIAGLFLLMITTNGLFKLMFIVLTDEHSHERA